jgi:hypothetical protein
LIGFTYDLIGLIAVEAQSKLIGIASKAWNALKKA